MKTLRKKAVRDIRKNLSSFITVFLMTFLGVFVFSGIHAYMDGMEKSGNEFYEEQNLQDLWVKSEMFTDEDFETIKTLKDVTDAERAFVLRFDLKGYDDVLLEASFIEENNISRMYVVDGEGFDVDKEGFWLDSFLADTHKIKVGDEITLDYNGMEISGKVLGLVNTPDHVYFIKDSSAIFPTHDDFGFVYASINMLPEAYRFFTNFYVTVSDDADLDAVKADIQVHIKNATAVIDREADPSYAAYLSEMQEGTSYSVIFTFLFLFIAILSVVSTMHRFVKKQRTQIGTLKALGVSRKKIQRHYVGFGFYISLVAAVLGVVLGAYVIGGFFINMIQDFYEVPNMKSDIRPIVYVVAAAIVAVITLITYITCRKVLKEPASESLRLEVPKVKVGSVKAASGLEKKMSVGVRWNLRDIKRNKGRTVTAVAGIVGCTMLVVCALGMKDTMNAFLDWQFDTLYRFDYKLDLEPDISDEALTALYDEYGKETTMTVAVEAESKNGKKSTQMVNINDAKELVCYTNHKRKAMSLSDDGVYLSEKLLGSLGYSVGDVITWSIYGDDAVYETKISGTVREPQAQDIYMTRACAEKLGITYRPGSVYTTKDMSNVKNPEGVSLVTDKGTLKDGMVNMLQMMDALIGLLILVSMILAFVIIYNLGVLSFTEKQYQFATMKVLGFRSKAVKKIYIMQNNWISVFSIILGLPLGYFMTYLIFTTALGDGYDMMVSIKPLTYILSAVGTFVVAYLINKILSGMIKKIDMVSSLKANE